MPVNKDIPSRSIQSLPSSAIGGGADASIAKYSRADLPNVPGPIAKCSRIDLPNIPKHF
jgi:hypothetical protein